MRKPFYDVKGGALESPPTKGMCDRAGTYLRFKIVFRLEKARSRRLFSIRHSDVGNTNNLDILSVTKERIDFAIKCHKEVKVGL